MAPQALTMPGIDIGHFRRNSDIYIAVMLIGILALMIIPLPAVLLDLCIAANIGAALAILLVTLYTTQPLDFASFPSVLLFTTLFRLSLNIASTRLILVHGHEGLASAGHVIKAFGQFVVGGNYVVGAVIFIILVIINFVVITKGAGRVAEVAARFTLDALPGKQMAIDADLSAGVIDEREARARRTKVSREADFYGSMDGASKFVRGDAVAGILIMVVNVIGGFIIGVWQQGMPFTAALTNYTLLTIGEGLVAQIPALVISTAAGVIVTRSADEKDFGSELTGQFLNYPKAFYIAGAILFVLALVPGMPHLSFLVLAAVLGALGRVADEQVRQTAAAGDQVPEELVEETGDGTGTVRPLDVLELEVGYGLVPLVDAAQEGELLERIRNLRRQFAQKMGFVVPPVHIHDNLQLKPYEYSILIRGVRIAGGELLRNYLAMDSGLATEAISGELTTEPVFGLAAYWIGEEEREAAQLANYTVVDSTTIVATHISEIVKRHAPELVGRQELQQLLDTVAQSHPRVVEDLIPGVVSLGVVLRVVKNLLAERVSIRDLRTILEAIADYAVYTQDPDRLTEAVRQALGRSIVEQHKREDGLLCVMTVDRQLEDQLADGIMVQDGGGQLAVDPETVRLMLASIRTHSEQFVKAGVQPVLLASTNLRRPLKKLTERFMDNLVVLSYGELPPAVKIQSLGVVSAHAS